MAEETGSIFNKDWWYGRIMDWSMQNEGFKTQMFRFVDGSALLNSREEISDIYKTKHLGFKPFILHTPIHDAAVPPVLG